MSAVDPESVLVSPSEAIQGVHNAQMFFVSFMMRLLIDGGLLDPGRAIVVLREAVDESDEPMMKMSIRTVLANIDRPNAVGRPTLTVVVGGLAGSPPGDDMP